MSDYQAFLERKAQIGSQDGFSPVWMPDFLFDFQKILVEWALQKGRSAIFADTGLGKSPIQLVFAENVVRQTNGRMLILTPLAVSYQILLEAEKFGIPCQRSSDGTVHDGITVTNYERLHYFNPQDFIGVCCDESGVLKHFGAVRQQAVTQFMKKLPYRLLCSATPAPNDYIELGTSSEALGYLGNVDMLNRFFKNDKNNSSLGRAYGQAIQWRFKGHAEQPFWRWVCSWARAVRKPSDLGGDDTPYQLPPLVLNESVIAHEGSRPDMLFEMPAMTLEEQREERRLTLKPRCELSAEKVAAHDCSIVWAHLNAEGDYLTKLIPGAKQIKGSDTDEHKESTLLGFMRGEFPVLVTKPSISGYGINLQRCAHMTMFPSHSFSDFYQSIRRCWRFGQQRPVTVDMITSEGELGVLKNLQRKADAAEIMYNQLITQMHYASGISRRSAPNAQVTLPPWLQS